MTVALVVTRGRKAIASGGLSAGGGRGAGNPTLSATIELPRESWLRRAGQAIAGLVKNEAGGSSPSRVHQMNQGAIERRHLPRGGRLFCRTGRVWVTADGVGEDVVLSQGEFRWFRPGTSLLIEALGPSEVLLES